jgi:hypothetical protein
MKSATMIAAVAFALAGCTLNGSAPITAWGKNGVSMVDYRTDAGQCTVLAATAISDTNSARSAGGISGMNSGIPNSPGASGSASAVAASQAGGLPLISGSLYRDSAPADFVNRAAMQQRTQEMSTQRFRTDALKSCLSSRGYREFELSAAQRADLARLPAGSEARRAYLYKLGTDPDVLRKQSISRRGPGS